MTTLSISEIPGDRWLALYVIPCHKIVKIQIFIEETRRKVNMKQISLFSQSFFS